nr:uncharacterized protein LOC131771903 isoform X3 [Pocillopora verrucosa]
MVRKFKLETANVTLTSQLTKNSTTNRFKVRAMFKIALCCSTLYRQSFMIRKILFVFTSYGQDDRRNEKQYLIFYSKSVIVPSPLVLSNASSVAHSTVRKPISEITLLVRPTSPSVDINILLGSLTTSVVPSPVRSTVALSSSVVRETDKPPVTETTVSVRPPPPSGKSQWDGKLRLCKGNKARKAAEHIPKNTWQYAHTNLPYAHSSYW